MTTDSGTDDHIQAGKNVIGTALLDDCIREFGPHR